MSFSLSALAWLTRLAGAGVVTAALIGSSAFLYSSPKLPSVASLKEVKFQTPLRVYSRDGLLIGEFGEKRASPLRYDQVPPLFIKAILAAEDDSFETHHGVDVAGLLRAASQILTTGSIQSGGSTITMQIARNFFLSREKTFSRKFNEILLALRIEQALSKQEILELYINKIYLGNRAYGIEAAAQVYYGKSIDQLSLAQWAMIAGLPKAPSAYNPLANEKRAVERRNWILGRMYQLGSIDQPEYERAIAEPEVASYHGASIALKAAYAAEMARQEMLQKYGTAAYEDGYKVYTTIDSRLQDAAQQSVRNGLFDYDARHGYRGPEKRLGALSPERAQEILARTPEIAGLVGAIVVEVGERHLEAVLRGGQRVRLGWEDGLKTARRHVNENALGPSPAKASDIAQAGDLIRVRRQSEQWRLAQIPSAEAALVALDANNGAVRAIVGGLDFERSSFNRVVQAERQPGSNFKPFLYAAALEHGYTAASVINDAPLVFEQTGDGNAWRPQNSDDEFMGPMRLRQALVLSRNAVSVRLLRDLGMDKAIEYFTRFGFERNRIPRELSIALGAHSVTPLQLVTGYASLANGGYRVSPFLVDRVENSAGKPIFQAKPATVCAGCDQAPQLDAGSAGGDVGGMSAEAANVFESDLPRAKRIMDARVAYIMDSMLHDVTIVGTGKRAKVLNRRDLAGKTGTTNGPNDAWFSGYGGSNMVVTTWVGFDNNTPLGRREYGGTAALPIWIDFMRVALEGTPQYVRPQPPGLVTVRIDPSTGTPARPGQYNAIFEVFKAEDIYGADQGESGGYNPYATLPAAAAPVETIPATAEPITEEEERRLLQDLPANSAEAAADASAAQSPASAPTAVDMPHSPAPMPSAGQSQPGVEDIF